jgi:HSP20 family protein
MNGMFNEMFGNLALGPRRQLNGIAEWAPAVDVVTKDGDIVVRAELPSVK